jgi:hypothetical protein
LRWLYPDLMGTGQFRGGSDRRLSGSERSAEDASEVLVLRRC